MRLQPWGLRSGSTRADLVYRECARRLDFATRSNDSNLDPRRRHTHLGGVSPEV